MEPSAEEIEERTVTAFSRGVDIGMSGGTAVTIFSPDGIQSHVAVTVPCETVAEAMQLLAGVMSAHHSDLTKQQILDGLQSVLDKAKGKS